MQGKKHLSQLLSPASLCIFISLAYLIAAVATAPHYGITWDQAMNEWYIGERNLHYLLTLDNSWLDFNSTVDLSMSGTHPDLRHTSTGWKTQNFGNMLSALGCYLFFFKLKLLGAVEAHQMPNLMLMAGVLAAMFLFMRKHFGLAVALITSFAIAFQPRLWAHAHFNTKDFPYACIMAFTMLAARRGILERSARWLAVASILLGLAGATKPNAILIPLIIAIWYFFSRGEMSNLPEKNRKYFVATLIAAPLIAMLVFIAAWPHLLTGPVEVRRPYLEWYTSWGAQGEAGFQWITFAIFIIVQPPAILLFGTAGIYVAIRGIKRNENREAYAFLLFWFAMPVIRVLLPRMYNYDGVRHFIEYAIPLGAITAIGALQVFKWIQGVFERLKLEDRKLMQIFAGLLVAIPFITWSITMVRIHPHELVYFNFLPGGATGVEEKCNNCGLATDYWGSSYRQGIQWLNENAEGNAIVVAPVAGHIVKSVQRMWMRPDIKLLVAKHKSDEFLKELLGKIPPDPVYVMYITRTRAYGDLVRRVESAGKLEHAIMVDGAPVLKIMRLEEGDG